MAKYAPYRNAQGLFTRKDGASAIMIDGETTAILSVAATDLQCESMCLVKLVKYPVAPIPR
jgi:hypothetical protein